MLNRTNGLSAMATLGTLVLMFPLAQAHAKAIQGGPTYDAASGTGYRLAFYPEPMSYTTENGLAIGNLAKYQAGRFGGLRPVHWDILNMAASELELLGTDNQADGYVYGLNRTGMAAGYSQKYVLNNDQGYRAVRWDSWNASPVELGSLGTSVSGYTTSMALCINNVAAMAGYAEKYESGASLGYRAVRWDVSGTAAIELGNLGTADNGQASSMAWAINDSGTIVGHASKYESGIALGDRAVRWDASGTAATELANLGTASNGRTNSGALAINHSGTSVGYAEKYESSVGLGDRAVRWDASGTAATELETLGTDDNGYTRSHATLVNTQGTAIGWAYRFEAGVNQGDRAVRWDASSTQAIELAHLGVDSDGYTQTHANAMNAAGIIVGWANEYDSDGVLLDRRAVAWGRDGQIINLNTLIDSGSGWINLKQAQSISDEGWITGFGSYDPDGAGAQVAYDRMYLLDATALVPEPASLGLMMLGGLAVFVRQPRSNWSRC